MNKYLWSIAFMLCIIAMQAQVLKVKDQMRQGLEFATAFNPGQNLAVITDAKGEADISAFRGVDTIVIRSLGYETVTTTYKQLEAKRFVVIMKADDVSLNAIVVTESRWKESKKDVPNRVVQVKKKDILFQNPQTSADLLGQTGEVFIQKSQQGGGSPMIRGFATNRLLITVDGVRMNTAIFRSGNIQNVISIDPLSVEQTEVIMGPGSNIYGSDAIGGVMNFYTLTPALANSGKVLVKGSFLSRYASANFEKTAHFDLNVGLSKWAFLTSLTLTDFDDLRMGSIGPAEYLRPTYVERINGVDSVLVNPNPLIQKPTGYTQLNVLQKIRFKPTANWDINYGFQYSTTTDYGRYDRLIRPRGNTLRSAEWNYGPQVWMLNNFSILHRTEKGIYDGMSIRLAHQRFEESRMDRDLNRPTRFVREEAVNALSFNLDFEKKLAPKHQLYYGAEYVHNLVSSTGQDENIVTGVTVDGPSRYPDASTWQSAGVYLNYKYNISEQFLIRVGARYSYFMLDATLDTTFYQFPVVDANINNGAATGSLGLVYSPTSTWQISLNGSTGFRSPNIDDVGKVFDSSPGAVVIPNTNLQGEYAYNGDLGIAKSFGNWLKVDVSGFYTLLDNALVRRNTTLNGLDSILYDGELSQVQSLQNAAQATVWGFNLGFNLVLPQGLSVFSRFTFQKGEEELDNGDIAPLRHAAPWFGITRLSYQVDKLRLEAYAQYSGAVKNVNLAPEEQGKTYIYAIDKDGSPYSPAWFTMNAKASYQLTSYFTLGLGVENIGDIRYRPYSSGIVSPGRNFILSGRVTF